MILQSTDELERYIGNKYSLVIVSAKRARQLKEGHGPLARDASPNPLSVALREIQEQRIQPVAPPEEEIAPAPRDVISSLVSGADFDLDEDLDSEDGDAVDDLAALLMGADEDEDEATETDAVANPLLTAATEDEEEEEAEEAEDTEDEETSLDEVEEDTDDEEGDE